MPAFVRALRAGISFVALIPAIASADDAVPVPPIVVSATRNPTPVDEVGSSMTVITSDDIAAKQDISLPDALNDVPGLNLVQGGGEGGVASVFMRGTDSNHTKVLVDGIDISDPTSPNGAVDFSNILTPGIGQIEVLRGPQSSLYGSDAIGGVINVTTKPGSGPAQFTSSVEGGSFDTKNESAGVSGSQGRFNYVFDITHLQEGELPVTPINLLAADEPHHDDYYDNLTYATKLGAAINDDVNVGLVARYVEKDSLYTADDDFAPYTTPDPVQSETRDKDLFTRATLNQKLFDGDYNQTFGLGYTNYDHEYFIANNAPEFTYGDRVKLDWQGNIRLAEGETGVVGADHQIDDLSTPSSAQMKNNGGFAELQSDIGERFFNAISVRNDNNSEFGNYVTWRDAPAILIAETDTKLKASYGTGFKAPTLTQLYVNFPGFSANPDLKPETSKGYDIGFEQNILNKQAQFGSTYFHNDIKDLIQSNLAGTTDINIGKATTDGFENFVSYKPVKALTLRADYTFTLAEDNTDHEELVRRPKNKADLTATWEARKDLRFTATGMYVGPWIDNNRAFTVPRLDAAGYATANLAAEYDIKDNVTVYGRIQNLLDHHYQEPVGFDQPPLGVYAGIKTKF